MCSEVFRKESRTAKPVPQDRFRQYKFLGANVTKEGTHFALWAPNARHVEVLIESDGWKQSAHLLKKDEATGIWSGMVDHKNDQLKYKYRLIDSNGHEQFRNDPYARFIVRNEHSGVWDSVSWNPRSYQWQTKNFTPPKKMRMMEVNPRTRVPGKTDVNYRELAHHLLPILKESGINTVSLMPITHHNVIESWGYQPGGIFAVNFRHGNPNDLKYFVDLMHKNDIAVLFDVVIGHASKDWDTGLGKLDGTQLYFHEASHLGEHRDWGTYIYNYGRWEVQDFLLSNVKFWAEEYKIDGIRLDGVTSMLYLDYSRPEHEKAQIWKEFGTNINHQAVNFIKLMNQEVKKSFPNFVTVAEESSGWPGVTRKVEEGGLGFDYMWGMGGMHHMRKFLKSAPEHRNLFDILAPEHWNEKYVHYVNSHDETAHGKRRYIEEINGASGTDKKFDFARVVTAWLYSLRGRPMLFQGDEIAEVRGWSHNLEVQEHLKQYEPHAKFQKFVHDLGKFHEKEPAFDRLDQQALQTLNVDNRNQVLTLARFGTRESEHLVIVMNFGSTTHSSYRLPVPAKGHWEVVFDSDASYYGGNGTIVKTLPTSPVPMHAYQNTMVIENLPAHSVLILKNK